MRSPEGEVARLLICKGSRLRRELREVTGVALAPGGVLVPLPPTVCADGSWSWWIDPAESNHRPGLAGATQAALTSAIILAKEANL